MQTTKPQRSLQDLTTTVTAFQTWVQFAEAMDGGYVPTLRAQPGRSKAQKSWNEACVELANRLRGLGYQVF